MLGRLVPRDEFEKVATEYKHHTIGLGHQHPRERRGAQIGRTIGGTLGILGGAVAGTGLARVLRNELWRVMGIGLPRKLVYGTIVPSGIILGNLTGRLLGGGVGKTIGGYPAMRHPEED